MLVPRRVALDMIFPGASLQFEKIHHHWGWSSYQQPKSTQKGSHLVVSTLDTKMIGVES